MATYGNLNVSTLNGGPLSGFRNAIINGNFGINQRAVSGTVTLAAGVYGHDRWKAGASGCTYTFATSENVTTLTISAGSLIQVVEGLNLMTGTYSLSWEGTAQGKIGAGSYGNSGITGAVTGGTDLNIEFGTGTLRLVQLEKGSVATPFEFRSIGQELALCQRYYQGWSKSSGICYDSGGIQWPYCLKVTMRATPTIAFASGGTQDRLRRTSTGSYSTANSAIIYVCDPNSAQFFYTASGWGTNALVVGQSYDFDVNFSAEL